MNDEQINAAIAAYLGITRKTGIPDFSGDLNEMHEAEKGLDGVTEWIGEEHNGSAEEALMTHLCAVIARDANQRVHDDWLFVHATARQRAEAFLRTLGKWENKND